jgi:hypothetical protein
MQLTRRDVVFRVYARIAGFCAAVIVFLIGVKIVHDVSQVKAKETKKRRLKLQHK